jgi:predicted secreted protein
MMQLKILSTGLFLTLFLSLLTGQSYAQSTTPEPFNLVRLDAVVSAPIKPDTAVLTMAAERSGSDASAITQTINKIMGDAVREAKTVSGVEAITGNFSTQQQYDNKGNVTGWTVRSDLILKSKDFASLGKLSGNLSQSLKIVSSGFEVSRALRSSEEAVLLQRGLEAFQAKAKTAATALGFGGYTLREINIQQAQLEGGNNPRPMMMMARGAMADAAPVQIEAGRTAINLTVSGSIQLK